MSMLASARLLSYKGTDVKHTQIGCHASSLPAVQLELLEAVQSIAGLLCRLLLTSPESQVNPWCNMSKTCLDQAVSWLLLYLKC